jgi:4'-phosphopantetheinyl transferase
LSSAHNPLTSNQQHEQARWLLEQLVGFSCNVEHDESGAPYLSGHPELNISISHCQHAVAAAVTDGLNVGIDIESRRRIGDGLMQRVCTAAELAEVEASADPVMHFLQLWTRKEAVLKCRRTGIQGFGSMVEALSDPTVTVHDIPCNTPDIVAAVAIAKPLG